MYGPEVAALETAVYVIPTDAPEADAPVAATAISAVDIAFVGPQGAAARAAAGRPARPGAAGRARVRQRRLHQLRRHAHPAAAERVGGEGADSPGQDQDRRGVGRERAPCRSPGTARPTCMRTSGRRCRTCGTWSTSTTISGSSGCSSRGPSTLRAARCARTWTVRVTAWSSEMPIQSVTGVADTRDGPGRATMRPRNGNVKPPGRHL